MLRIVQQVFTCGGKRLAWDPWEFSVEVLAIDDGPLVGAVDDAPMEIFETCARFEKAALVAAADGDETLEARCAN